MIDETTSLTGLTESTLTSEGMSADDLAAGRFGGGLGRKNFQRNLQSRVSEFDKDAGIAMGQQGIYGLGSAE